jgi:prolyl 4-hydroxylase
MTAVKALALISLIGIVAHASPVVEEAAAASIVEKTCSAVDADGTCVENNALEENNEEEEEEIHEYTHKFNFECIDKHENCPTWAAAGDCTGEPAGYVSAYCPKSCNTCNELAAKASSNIPAYDVCKDDHYQCSEWSGMGECDANPKYMRNYCQRSCLECYDNTSQFGLEQRVPKNQKERELTTKRIGETVEYMKKVWNDDEFIKVRHKCRNTHEDCSFWASLGECEENEKYMKTNCAPACYSCDLLDIRHRCPIEPDNVCIWEPGDLNTLFENIVDNADGKGEYEKYNPKALSRPKMSKNGTQVEGVEVDGPWIVLLENFLSEEEADRLVEIGKKQGYERSADVGKEKPDGSHDSLVSDSRTSHNTWCQEKSCYEDPLVAPVIERIAEVSKTSVQNSEYLQLLQYEPSQYYKQHHDYIPHHRDMPCGVRILTLFIYLNDVEEGGGTSFPLVNNRKGIVVQPKKGNAVLWPSVLDNEPESKDGRTEHEALPVLKGLKYGANAWIHSRDFKAAFAKNCH